MRKKRPPAVIDLEPHSFVSSCLENSPATLVKHKVQYVVNNVNRVHTLMATDPMDAIERTKVYLKGEER